MKAIWFLIAFPIALALFLKFYPEVVLHVPMVGFILYHLIKGAPIPPYIESNQYENDRTWLKPNDVVAAIAGKAGTTWMMATLHGIRTKGDFLLSIVIFTVCCYFQFI